MRSAAARVRRRVGALLTRVPVFRDGEAALRHYAAYVAHVVRCLWRGATDTGRILWRHLRVEAVLAAATLFGVGYLNHDKTFVSAVRMTTVLWFEIVFAFAAAILIWQVIMAPVRLRRENTFSNASLPRPSFDPATESKNALDLATRLSEFVANREKEIEAGTRDAVRLIRRKDAINARVEDPEDTITRQQFREAFGVETIMAVERLKSIGRTDERLDRFYNSPKSLDEIREIADRLKILGDGIRTETHGQASALRKATDRDRTHWRGQILSLGYALSRRCEKTAANAPEFEVLREEVKDYVADMRGPAIAKFAAGPDLLAPKVERRLLEQGGPEDLNTVVQSYVALFEQ